MGSPVAISAFFFLGRHPFLLFPLTAAKAAAPAALRTRSGYPEEQLAPHTPCSVSILRLQ